MQGPLLITSCSPLHYRHHLLSHRVQSISVCHASVHCYLVGAGLGSADYLTLKAARLIEEADVLVYDDLGTDDETLALTKASCLKLYVGKRKSKADSMKQSEINELLVQECFKLRDIGVTGDENETRVLVRLKGGDPGVFGRATSEMRALEAAGISYSLVPGISSVLAAPLLAGFSLTDVTKSRSFLVTTTHDVDACDWASFSSIPTLVFVMGGSNLPKILIKLVSESKRRGDEGVCVVRNAGRDDQRVWRGTIETIEGITVGQDLSPCVIVVGEVVGGSELA